MQFAIQSKAGDIGLAGWREVRPQLEESVYNTRAHPSFDPSLKRVAVLVTTGRLKGAAAVDAQEFKESIERRTDSKVEFWDLLTLTDWLCDDPESGLAGRANTGFLDIISSASNGEVREPDLERYTRKWLEPAVDALAVASIEAAVMSNTLRTKHRLDLAAAVALQLLRAAVVTDSSGRQQGLSASARRLFVGYATELLQQTRPHLADPKELSRVVAGPFAIVTYQVMAVRLFEIFGLLALVAEATGTHDVAEQAREAVLALARTHPGSARPASDGFAVSLLAPVLVLYGSERALCRRYLKSVAEWLLDRHDSEAEGLGLGSVSDSEEQIVERLLGGALESTQATLRRQSYLAAVILDLTWLTESRSLHDAIRDNLETMGIHAVEPAVDPERARWRRGGDGVGGPSGLRLGERYAGHEHSAEAATTSELYDDLLLASVSRSWYRFDSLRSLYVAANASGAQLSPGRFSN
ncbi:hypothetical protein [Paenarthrobacter sp. A20]|uniref:hypothetical protein n=1 Tax=Paenarthrobacter sp. A20 TaxID=2817891 RepID=UPI0035A90916|nr:hypothetical protein [Paenarthrobacter sp. A20]